MLKVRVLKSNNDKKTIKTITKIKESGKYPDGLFELFCELLREGVACSYDHSRIYFLAYLLSKEYIAIEVKEADI